MAELTDVFITGEPAKLPPPYSALTDPAKPLPAGVEFFERRVTFGELLRTVVLAVGVSVVGLASSAFGAVVLFGHHSGSQRTTQLDWLPLVFGLVCLLAAGMMTASLRTSWGLMRRQDRGEATRLGIFLLPGSLLEANEFGYCIVPRSRFLGLAAGAVRYSRNGEEKSFRLPGALVGGDTARLTAAIERWAAAPAA